MLLGCPRIVVADAARAANDYSAGAAAAEHEEEEDGEEAAVLVVPTGFHSAAAAEASARRRRSCSAASEAAHCHSLAGSGHRSREVQAGAGREDPSLLHCCLRRCSLRDPTQHLDPTPHASCRQIEAQSAARHPPATVHHSAARPTNDKQEANRRVTVADPARGAAAAMAARAVGRMNAPAAAGRSWRRRR